MFAIIKTGGKQYRVTKGTKLLVEKLEGDAGSEVKFSEVLMTGDETSSEVGAPFVKGVEVVAKLTDQIKDKKVIIFKKKRRQNYRRKRGHRQLKSVIEIVDILKGGKSIAPATVKKAAAKDETKEKAPAKAEAKTATAKPAAKKVAKAKPEAKEKAESNAEPKKVAKKAAPKTTTKK
ncbi:MAG: 50S ribosomal protein L21 [Rickettsiales bacterium]|nr:50S ribosomal protein L21 [Rickettsiales bacterium]|tara:strand:+ start:17135 stop:17665 length:531 start_codon:yes stop_codon:yes gene_type:complete